MGTLFCLLKEEGLDFSKAPFMQLILTEIWCVLAYFCLALELEKRGSCRHIQLEPKMFSKLIMPKIGMIIHANINSVFSHRNLLAHKFS